MLSLPDIIQWYMERIFPIERTRDGRAAARCEDGSRASRCRTRVSTARCERFYDKLEGVRKVLTDAETTSIRLVVNPEKMVIAEAMRTFTYLNLFGYRVDAVIANRLLPDEVSDPYFDRWKELQNRTPRDDPGGVLAGPDPHGATSANRSCSGPPAPRDAGVARSTRTLDPADVLFTDDPMTIVKHGDLYMLTLRLSFARKEDLELSTKADELFVKVGPYGVRSCFPRCWLRAQIASAALKDDRLEIVFERSDHGTR